MLIPLPRRCTGFVCLLGLIGSLVTARAAETNTPPTSGRQGTNDPIRRIRDEGLSHSHVMETLSYLTDVIGPRLTASPNFKRAAEWSREQLESYGLTQAHLEPWGPFGRGWSLERFSAQIVEPQTFPLIAAPRAWSGGLEQPLTADVIHLDATTEADLDRYKGKLKGAIVLVSTPRDLKAWFDAPGTRMTDVDLLRLANAGEGNVVGPRRPTTTNAASSARNTSSNAAPRVASTNAPARTNGPATRPVAPIERFRFAVREGAAVLVSNSSEGDGGTIFAAAANVPTPPRQGTNVPPTSRSESPWSTNAPPIPAQMLLASEDYNRLVRMLRQGEKPRMAVEYRTRYHTEDLMGYNVIAEIPGTDLKDEIVMLGGHLDSWHSGTGATDNGAGVAVGMEAVRLLQTLKLQPRRTIRIALWGGEEQGLLGSAAYVAKHFGYYTNHTNASLSAIARAPKDERAASPAVKTTNAEPKSIRQLVRHRDYDRFNVYFNLDYGGGKVRGVFLQGNEAVRSLFRRWLEPFRDLGAETLTLSNAGGTDHLSFDAIRLPGFQFVQDPLEYFTRTHHSNMDVYDRLQPDDLKQASVIMASFVYQAAMLDEKLPRKPEEKARR